MTSARRRRWLLGGPAAKLRGSFRSARRTLRKNGSRQGACLAAMKEKPQDVAPETSLVKKAALERVESDIRQKFFA
jgi:hypothetical protein